MNKAAVAILVLLAVISAAVGLISVPVWLGAGTAYSGAASTRVMLSLLTVAVCVGFSGVLLDRSSGS